MRNCGKARTMVFSDYAKMGGRLLPARMRVVPADKPAEYTEIIYHEIVFDLALDDRAFSLQNLQK